MDDIQNPADIPLPPDLPELAQPYDALTQNFNQLRLDLRTQSLTLQVRNFNGEGHRSFKNWLEDMEKAGKGVMCDADRMQGLALQKKGLQDTAAGCWTNNLICLGQSLELQ